MIINVELNTSKELIWSLPDTDLMLTGESPKTSIDTDKITDKQKWAIAVSILSGRILSDTTHDKIYKQPQLSQPNPIQQNTSPINSIETIQREASENLAIKAKEILSGVSSEIRKELLMTKDIRLIKIMLALEEGSSRKRAAIIKAIKDKLNTIEDSVRKSLETEADSNNVLIQDPSLVIHKGQQISYSVLESKEDERVVSIPMPSKPTV